MGVWMGNAKMEEISDLSSTGELLDSEKKSLHHTSSSVKPHNKLKRNETAGVLPETNHTTAVAGKKPSDFVEPTPLPNDKKDEESGSGEKTAVESKWRKKIKVILPHVTLVVATILYTLLGAGIFYYIERPNEEHLKKHSTDEVKQLQVKFIDEAWQSALKRKFNSQEEYGEYVGKFLDDMVAATFTAFDNGVIDKEIVTREPKMAPLKWTYPSAIFFSTTVITTIGYGDLVPKTVPGKVFCVAYALLGIPLALITIADVGKFVSLFLMTIFDRYQIARRKYCMRRKKNATITSMLRVMHTSPSALSDTNNNPSEEKIEEVVEDEEKEEIDEAVEQMKTRFPPTLVLLILLGYTAISALLFCGWEGWNFGNSFYFSFITMVTVGFGDLVPSEEKYMFFAIIFIVLGLVLTTMSIDLVGTHYIRQVHYFGRKFQDVQHAFALLGDKGGDWIRQMRVMQTDLGIGDDQLKNMLKSGKMMPFNKNMPFKPTDIELLKYIDHLTSSEENTSFLSCEDL